MAVIRLARSPFAFVGRWWDRSCARARLRWAENDLMWIKRQQERDLQVESALRGHIAHLRVELALLEK